MLSKFFLDILDTLDMKRSDHRPSTSSICYDETFDRDNFNGDDLCDFERHTEPRNFVDVEAPKSVGSNQALDPRVW